jgi:hypothetical protein
LKTKPLGEILKAFSFGFDTQFDTRNEIEFVVVQIIEFKF